MKNVYILRGLAGSGKSTLAEQLSADSTSICSTDDFFMVNGVYKFDATKLSENHARNFQRFEHLLAHGWEPVVVDNTNMLKSHMRLYEIAAEKYGYRWHHITVGNPKDPQHQEECAKRNKHGVTLDVIQKMAKKWEP